MKVSRLSWPWALSGCVVAFVVACTHIPKRVKKASSSGYQGKVYEPIKTNVLYPNQLNPEEKKPEAR